MHRLTDAVGDAATAADEVYGFKSFNERDLTGFVDGTANPEGGQAHDAVFVETRTRGSPPAPTTLVQRYRHDLAAWHALRVDQQKAAVGRSKLSNIEFPDKAKTADSHITMNTVLGRDGEEARVFRANMSSGSVGDRDFGM